MKALVEGECFHGYFEFFSPNAHTSTVSIAFYKPRKKVLYLFYEINAKKISTTFTTFKTEFVNK